jgi:hypothetical protein
MPAQKKTHEYSRIVPDARTEVPMEELEDRLEMQHLPALDPSLACYTDLCPQNCAVFCSDGYSGCTDLCGCDGAKCVMACVSLCTVDSCLVDIL